MPAPLSDPKLFDYRRAPDLVSPTGVHQPTKDDAIVALSDRVVSIEEDLGRGADGLLPVGGEAGDILVKLSDADYEAQWQSPDSVFDALGYVKGPAVSTDTAVARFDGTTGQQLSNSPVLISDTGAVSGVDHLILNPEFVGGECTDRGCLDFNSNRLVETAELHLGPGRPTLQLGQEEWYQVRNAGETEIPNGTPVAFVGVDPVTTDKLVLPVEADNESLTFRRSYVGLTTEALPPYSRNVTGKVVYRGDANDIDTSQWPAGTILYVGNEPGGLVDKAPDFPSSIIIVGAVTISDATKGQIAVKPTPFAVDSEFDGCVTERQDVFLVDDGGTLYIETELAGGGDLRVQFGGDDFLLNCTTGGGIGGRARSNPLTIGTDTSIAFTFVWIEIDANDKAFLTSGASLPNAPTPFAQVCWVGLWSYAKTLAEGPPVWRRTTDAIAHDGRGRISYIDEWIRVQGATWLNGVAPTSTIDPVPSPDQVNFAVSAGEVKQLHTQSYPPLDIVTDGIFVANASGLGVLTQYQKLTNLAEALETTDGSLIGNNRRYTLVVFGLVNHNGESKLFVNLPAGTYAADDTAYADTNNFAITGVPADLRTNAFLICAIPLRYNNAGGGTFSYVGDALSPPRPQLIDLRGVPLGVSGSASGGQASTFSDAVFRLFNDLDATKLLAFDLAGITTSTTRTLTVPDKDGTIATLDDIFSASPLTTKGDLYGYDTAAARVPVGPDGYVLTANSAVPLGLDWQPGGSGSGNVTAAANLADNALVRGDGGTTGVQSSGWLLGDDDVLVAGGILDMNNSGVINTQTVSFTAQPSNPGGAASVWISTVNGHLYRGDVDLEAAPPAAGPDNAVQYNDGGVLAGDVAFTFDGTAVIAPAYEAPAYYINEARDIGLVEASNGAPVIRQTKTSDPSQPDRNLFMDVWTTVEELLLIQNTINRAITVYDLLEDRQILSAKFIVSVYQVTQQDNFLRATSFEALVTQTAFVVTSPTGELPFEPAFERKRRAITLLLNPPEEGWYVTVKALGSYGPPGSGGETLFANLVNEDTGDNIRINSGNLLEATNAIVTNSVIQSSVVETPAATNALQAQAIVSPPILYVTES